MNVYSRLPAHSVRCLSLLGFTLIELMVCLAVVAILSVITVPNYSQWVKDNRVLTTSNQLKSLLALARAESVRRSSNIVVCRTESENACVGKALRGKTQWQQALVFVDNDNNRVWDSSSERLIRVHGFEPAIQVVWNKGDMLRYQTSGYLNPSSIGSYYIFDEQDIENGRRLVVQMSGRVRSTTLTSAEVVALSSWLSSE